MASNPAQPRSDEPQHGNAEAEIPPVPDEDGPHDVPDEKVIEKTLPSSKPGSTGR